MNEALFRAIIDANEGFEFVRDIDGRIVISNRSYAAFLGLEPEDVEGRFQIELYGSLGWNQPMVEKWLEEDRQVIETQQPFFIEERVVHKDGAVRWYRTRKLPLVLPDGREAVRILSDIVTEKST